MGKMGELAAEAEQYRDDLALCERDYYKELCEKLQKEIDRLKLEAKIQKLEKEAEKLKEALSDPMTDWSKVDEWSLDTLQGYQSETLELLKKLKRKMGGLR